MERFGILPVLFPAFLLGTAATVGLGYAASSVALAATFIGLVGLFMGLGPAGAIALSALIYPTPIRSTGVGWGMAMGRFGQIVGPLIAESLLGAGWTADRHHDRHRLRRTDRRGFRRSLPMCVDIAADDGVCRGESGMTSTVTYSRVLSAILDGACRYAVSTVRPTTRPARRSSSAACALRERPIAGRDRRDICRRAPDRAARAPRRACRSACPRSSSP